MTRTERTDWTGRVLRLRIEGPAQGGEFVARHSGRVVFCRGGISGELVEVMIHDDPGRAFCRGTVTGVLERSVDRIDPLCPAAAAGAGCCDWSHIDPAAARAFSGTVLADQARRIGRIPSTPDRVPVGVPAGDGASTGWRTIARWVTGSDGVPGVRRSRSREVVTEPCVQADPRLAEAVRTAGVGPHREVLGVLGDDGEVHVAHRPVTEPATRGRDRGSRRGAATRARARSSRAGAWEPVMGPPTVTRRVGEHTWRLPVDAFWQSHRSAAVHYSDLVRRAVSATAGLPAEPVVWDLYGGAGLFSAAVLDVAPRAQLTIVESARPSLDSVGTALDVGPGVVPVAARVETFLDRTVGGTDRNGEPDLVILDPPRGGAGIDVMTALAGGTASRIIHVGCDPASLARDVGVLVTAGWTLTDLRGVAAFPATHHVEGLAVLDSPRAR